MTENNLMASFPSDLEAAYAFAARISGSGLIPKAFQGKPDDILVAMMWASNLKMPFLQILQGIAVINGRPVLWGDTALAVVCASGLLEDMKEEIKEVNGVLVAVCSMKRKGQATAIVRSFSFTQAETAGLAFREVWRKYPQRLLQMRARSYAIRDGFADVLNGIGVEDEMDNQSELTTPVQVQQSKQFMMPKRKEVPQIDAKPQPTIETVEEKEKVAVFQEVKAQSPAQAQQAEVSEEGNLFDVELVSEWKEEISKAQNKNDLKAIFKSSPKEIREHLKEAYTAKSNELAEAESIAASLMQVPTEPAKPMPKRASAEPEQNEAPF